MKNTNQQDKPRGGARAGGGRRAADGSTEVQRVTITLTEEDRAKLRSLGGSPWVRQQIRSWTGP